jgi:hypothetical protein
MDGKELGGCFTPPSFRLVLNDAALKSTVQLKAHPDKRGGNVELCGDINTWKEMSEKHPDVFNVVLQAGMPLATLANQLLREVNWFQNVNFP